MRTQSGRPVKPLLILFEAGNRAHPYIQCRYLDNPDGWPGASFDGYLPAQLIGETADEVALLCNIANGALDVLQPAPGSKDHALFSLTFHILAMKGDAHFDEHPEWHTIVAEAEAALDTVLS